MNNSEIVKFKDIDLKCVELDAPVKKKKSNGKSSYISKISINDKPFYFLSPKLKCIDFNKDDLQIKLELSSDFKDFLDRLHCLVKNKIYNNSSYWFKKSLSKEYISNSFYPSFKSVKTRQGEEFTLSSYLDKDIEMTCDFGDPLENLINSDLFLMFHISDIWISQQHFGIQLHISQLKVVNKKSNMFDFSTFDEDDSDFDYPSEPESESESESESFYPVTEPEVAPSRTKSALTVPVALTPSEFNMEDVYTQEHQGDYTGDYTGDSTGESKRCRTKSNPLPGSHHKLTASGLD
jgi:hypothetical protein